ncbi:MAG: ArsR/SmtB family transcription factor [Candidatus Thorarchaeota archaeon]
MLSNSDITELSDKTKQVLANLEVYKSEIRLNIIILLLINEELSLGEIADFLQKSKPTISRHMKVLIELGLIEMYNKEEPQRGNIKRNYYSLNRGKLKFIEIQDAPKFQAPDMQDNLLAWYELNQSIFLLLDRINEFINVFGQSLRFLIDHQTTPESLDQLLHTKMPKVNLRLLTETQYRKFEEKLDNFLLEIKEIVSEEDDDQERPYMFLDILLPIKELITLEGRV